MPRVSILLPNLNNRPFLEERLETIQAQTLTDWELIVTDSQSDDGAWEFFQAAAARDPRLRIAQAPRDGMYPNWNRCLNLAHGDFIYIATSDDTMTPDCLAEMVAALDAHPECDIAQCCLHGIDEHGAIIPDWWRMVGAVRFLGEDYLRPHLRRAPYDGVLHCVMHTIYHSITQVMVRRRAFARTGPFPTAYGAGGDFYWGLMAGLLCDVVHVPKFLATWRMHSAQASANHHETVEERALMLRMVDDGLASLPAGSLASQLPTGPLRFTYLYEHFRHSFARADGRWEKFLVLTRFVVKEPRGALQALGLVVGGQRRIFDKRAYAARLLRRFGLEKNFIRLPGPPTPLPPP